MWVFFIIIPLAAIAWVEIYDRTAHCRCNDASLLRHDACPIDATRKIVGLKGSRRVRTTVLFDDGFIFISHKTDVADHFLTYSISVSAMTHKEIICDAIVAHEKAVKKRDKRIVK